MSGLTYLLFVVMFLRATPAFMYVASAALGFGDAIIWTARGEFIHLQSNSERSVLRNTGIFTCLFQCRYILYRTYLCQCFKI